jgi:hypothetical protein
MVSRSRITWPLLARWGLAVMITACALVAFVYLFTDNSSLARFWTLTAIVLLALRQLLVNSDNLAGLHARLDTLDRGQGQLTELYRRRAWGEKHEE